MERPILTKNAMLIESYYYLYQQGAITEKEYLRIKDQLIKADMGIEAVPYTEPIAVIKTDIRQKLNRTCVVCGKEFEGGPAAKYCGPDCRKRAKKDQQESKSAEEAVVKAGPDGQCLMLDCRYKSKTGVLPICDYLGMTGQPRGCDVDGCTKYQKQ